jgi:hypothetical protein
LHIHGAQDKSSDGCAVVPSCCRELQPGYAGLPQEQHQAAAADAAQQQEYANDFTRHDIAAAYQQTGRPITLQQPRRPEYALFLACMAWLHHTPDRQQYKQQLYECFDFNAMLDNELSQVNQSDTHRHMQPSAHDAGRVVLSLSRVM